MLNPKIVQAWYTLMAEAMKGTANAQEALRSMSEMSGTPEDMNRWMATWMPSAASTTGFTPEAFETQLEEWWRMMGMVPRARYLDLLEKCDTLQRRLDKAEETIKNLRQKAGGQSQQGEETRKVLDMWSTMMEETLKTQNDWMKAWTAANAPEAAESQEETPPDTSDQTSD